MADPNLKRALKKLCPVLLEAQERNLNEADTRLRVMKLLTDVLGYDGLSEISSEQRVRERYVDFAVKIDTVIKFLLEVKAAGATLRDRHIEQAERYAAEGNIPWVLLTNGVVWSLYHLTFDEGIDYERTFSVDVTSDPIDEAAALIGLLHRKSVIKGYHQRFWEEKLALSPQSLSRVLFAEGVLGLIRREIRRQEGFLIDPEDLAKALYDLFTSEVREQMGPVKIRRRRKPKRRPRQPKIPAQAEAEPDTQEPITPEDSIIE